MQFLTVDCNIISSCTTPPQLPTVLELIQHVLEQLIRLFTLFTLCYVLHLLCVASGFWWVLHINHCNFTTSLNTSHHKSAGDLLHVRCALCWCADMKWHDMIDVNWHWLWLTMTYTETSTSSPHYYLLKTTGSINWDTKHHTSFQPIHKTQQNWPPYRHR